VSRDTFPNHLLADAAAICRRLLRGFSSAEPGYRHVRSALQWHYAVSASLLQAAAILRSVSHLEPRKKIKQNKLCSILLLIHFSCFLCSLFLSMVLNLKALQSENLKKEERLTTMQTATPTLTDQRIVGILLCLNSEHFLSDSRLVCALPLFIVHLSVPKYLSHLIFFICFFITLIF
jgi:hypothetical protein